MRILLVENHRETADRLTVLLQKANETIEVFTAPTLAEGITKSNGLRADITLLDLFLPDVKDWRETCAAIPRFHPPVIVVSEMDDPDVKVECYKAGAVDVFSKKVVTAAISVLLSAATSAKMRSLVTESAT